MQTYASLGNSDSKYGDVIRKIKRTALGDQFVGADCGELTPKVQYLLRFCRRVEHSAAQHRADLVETLFKRLRRCRCRRTRPRTGLDFLRGSSPARRPSAATTSALMTL